MFDGTYPHLMAEYNRWMNGKIYTACATLSDEERKRDRGAFFRSIHRTLDHLIRADRAWATRLEIGSYPPSALGEELFAEFDLLRAARNELDGQILAWARTVTPAWLAEPVTWTSKLYGMTQTIPRWAQITQMFNHQTHHRGQVHAMLTGCGIDVGPTDLPVLPILNEGPS